MGCIPTKGITPYYIDLNLPENKEMKQKTFAYNKWYFLNCMTVNERINMKSWHPLAYDRGLMLMLHLVNDTFMTAPHLDSYEGSIFACDERQYEGKVEKLSDSEFEELVEMGRRLAKSDFGKQLLTKHGK